MKSSAMRVASSLLVLAFLVSSVPVFATPPAPGPGSAVIQAELDALFYQTNGVAFGSGLTQGERVSLGVKLIHARDAVARGNDQAALNDLASFINELNALVQSGRLTQADAAPLAAQANLIASQIASGA